MTREELILYWTETSDSDYNTMIHLFEAKDYHWSLFIGHLVIEKLIKALYVKNNEEYENIPRAHDLLYLAEKATLKLTDDQKKILAVITSFNISARYPDYKKAFYDKCTQEYCKNQIKNIEDVRLWLKEMLLTEA
jgi:HEPN domain-containing protein